MISPRIITKARNLRLHFKSKSSRHEFVFYILEAIIRNYYHAKKEHEYMALTKPNINNKNMHFLQLHEGRSEHSSQRNVHFQP